jgi:hypothetical protein
MHDNLTTIAPLHELSLRDGTLFHTSAGLPPAPILDAPPIAIVAKAGIVDVPGADVAFLFQLNHPGDDVWTQQFQAQLHGVKAEIQGSQLELRCPPEDLQSEYAAVTSAIGRVNESYSRLQAELCKQVAAHHAEVAAQASAAALKQQAAHAAWERLEV